MGVFEKLGLLMDRAHSKYLERRIEEGGGRNEGNCYQHLFYLCFFFFIFTFSPVCFLLLSAAGGGGAAAINSCPRRTKQCRRGITVLFCLGRPRFLRYINIGGGFLSFPFGWRLEAGYFFSRRCFVLVPL